MQLDREAHTLNLSAEATVLTYSFSGSSAIVVLARVDLGISPNQLSGTGGPYTLNFYLNGDLLTPVSTVIVPAGKLAVVMASRSFPLEPGDTVTLTVIGQAGDTLVNTIASLQDVTPAQAEDLVGDGTVPVTQNYGGTDALTVMTHEGARIAGATILAYRAADYVAGNYTQEFVVARVLTDVNGWWLSPMMLAPGAYVLLVYKQNVIETALQDLTVAVA